MKKENIIILVSSIIFILFAITNLIVAKFNYDMSIKLSGVTGILLIILATINLNAVIKKRKSK